MNQELWNKLAEPFAQDEVLYKPLSIKQDKAIVLAYITARSVMDRLDAVVGPERWKDRYAVLSAGQLIAVECQLAIHVGSSWIVKRDVGTSEPDQAQGDAGFKAAYSDALKRAAVKFGIGRYLYRLPRLVAPFRDGRILQPPQLPDWARPAAPPSSSASDATSTSSCRAQAVEQILNDAARQGMTQLEFVWKKQLTSEDRKSFMSLLPRYKEIAARHDEEAESRSVEHYIHMLQERI